VGVSDILELSAEATAAAAHAGELDPGELFAFYRSRAQEPEALELNCFCWLAAGVPDGSSAAEAPLGGVPLGVKDLFCTAGAPSQSGSLMLKGYIPPYTATAVQRALDAGAPLLGKTNQDEFAMGSSTEHCAFGAVRNPWDRNRVPGGSSGGSAAAVAAGLVPWALGTDTGGSIRQPASFCGIVGLKPTYGAVSRHGMIAFASSLDQAGPLSRSVRDAALLLGAIAGRDRRDATSVGLPEPLALPQRTDLEGVTFGVARELSAQAGAQAGGIEPGVQAAFERALELAMSLGARIEEVSLPHAALALSAYYVLAPAEASSNLARFDGVRFGHRSGDERARRELYAMYAQSRSEGFGAEVKRRIMLGTYVLSAGYYDAYYGQAQKVRTLIAEDFRRLFAGEGRAARGAAAPKVDFLLTPTAATVAFELGAVQSPWQMYLNDYFTVPMSLAGIPAISIPCGLSGKPGDSASGMPIGLQIAGPAFSEGPLLEVAHALEQALGFDGSPARRHRGLGHAHVNGAGGEAGGIHQGGPA